MDQLCNTEQWYICATFYEAVRTLRRVTTVRCTNDVKLCSDVCLGRQIFFVLFLSRTSGRCILMPLFIRVLVVASSPCLSHTAVIQTWALSRYVTTGKYSTKYFLTSYQRVFCAQCKSLFDLILKSWFSRFLFRFLFFFFFPAKLAAKHTNLCKTYTTNVRTLGLLHLTTQQPQCINTSLTLHANSIATRLEKLQHKQAQVHFVFSVTFTVQFFYVNTPRIKVLF